MRAEVLLDLMGGPLRRRIVRGAANLLDANPWGWVPTIVAVLLLVGLALRLDGYTTFPRFGANEDSNTKSC